jgi:hypothetical protein
VNARAHPCVASAFSELARACGCQLGPTVVGGPVINIQPVTEDKVGKSRVHLDLWVDDLRSATGLVERLGGRMLETHTSGEWTIHVMADPEGVEFCLVGGPPTRQSESS